MPLKQNIGGARNPDQQSSVVDRPSPARRSKNHLTFIHHCNRALVEIASRVCKARRTCGECVVGLRVNRVGGDLAVSVNTIHIRPRI